MSAQFSNNIEIFHDGRFVYTVKIFNCNLCSLQLSNLKKLGTIVEVSGSLIILLMALYREELIGYKYVSACHNTIIIKIIKVVN